MKLMKVETATNRECEVERIVRGKGLMEITNDQKFCKINSEIYYATLESMNNADSQHWKKNHSIFWYGVSVVLTLL